MKVNQTLYSPGESLKVPGVWGSQISKHSAQESGMVVGAASTSHLELFLVLIFVKGCIDSRVIYHLFLSIELYRIKKSI